MSDQNEISFSIKVGCILFLLSCYVFKATENEAGRGGGGEGEGGCIDLCRLSPTKKIH